MSVNSNGIAIHAHESLTIDEIIDIIMQDDDLKSKVFRSIHDMESLRRHLDIPGILVRTRGRDKERIKERAMTPITCECGCPLHMATISRHRKT
jgi:hypothetical protein